MTLLFDSGALISAERGDRDLIALAKGEARAGRVPLTHGGIVAQTWRGGRGKPANLARLLAGLEVRPLDEVLGRRAGELLAAARTSDAIDAALVALSLDGDVVLTSDAHDFRRLAAAHGAHVEIVSV